MTSPIDILKQFIILSPRRIAPEKSDCLLSLLKKHSITFQFESAERRILFQATNQNVIRAGEKCLERLWALSYGYFVLFDALRTEKLRKPSTNSIDINCDPETRKAADLLSWATSTDWQIAAEGKNLSSPLPDWPESLPRPIENATKGSNEDVADKLFLTAVGFILHHELAHVRLGHTTSKAEGPESILNEKNADREAAKWLLDGSGEKDKEFIQRIFGITVALMWLAAPNAYVPHSSISHPPGYDRLYQTLFSFVSDDCHPVWVFVASSLLLHLEASGANYDSGMRHQSPQQAVNYYCDVLPRRFSGGGE